MSVVRGGAIFDPTRRSKALAGLSRPRIGLTFDRLFVKNCAGKKPGWLRRADAIWVGL